MGNRLSVSDVLNRFYHAHGNKYTYELYNFKTVLDKISIKCPKHGFFNQSIRKHYSGQGCPKCKGKNKTTEDVINEFKKVHKNKYIYDCVDFVNNKKPITIKCKTHGYFKQLYDSHIKGAGCPKCAGNLILDTDQFIQKSKSIYGDKYSYEKTTYVNSKSKVIITCKTHGDFKQSPINHYRCEGCPKCAYEKSKKTNEEFIEKSKSIHGSKYDYSLVRYTHNSKKVVIVCRKHGKFTQTPNAHTSGYGCLKCGRDKSRTYISENPTGWRNTDWIKASLRSKNFDSFKVYVIKCWNDEEEFQKIGRTFTTVKHRFLNKKINMPYNYEILKEFIFDEGKDAFDYENELKRTYKNYKYTPKITFKGSGECFKLPPSALCSL